MTRGETRRECEPTKSRSQQGGSYPIIDKFAVFASANCRARPQFPDETKFHAASKGGQKKYFNDSTRRPRAFGPFRFTVLGDGPEPLMVRPHDTYAGGEETVQFEFNRIGENRSGEATSSNRHGSCKRRAGLPADNCLRTACDGAGSGSFRASRTPLGPPPGSCCNVSAQQPAQGRRPGGGSRQPKAMRLDFRDANRSNPRENRGCVPLAER